MSEHIFYIEEEGRKTGPFDVMDMIKRIRNGKLQEDTQVFIDDEDEPVGAGSIGIFREYFHEDVAPAEQAQQQYQAENLNLATMLKFGINEVAENQETVIVAGGGCLALVAISAVLHKALPLAAASLIGSLLGGMGIFFFMSYVLFKLRGQEAGSALKEAFRRNGNAVLVPLALVSLLLLALPGVIAAFVGHGAFVLLILTFVVFGLFLFAPFYWADGACAGGGCLKQSWKWVASQKTDTVSTLVLLLLLNALAATLFLVPFFITFPMTAFALAELYERTAIYMPPAE